MAGAPLGNQNAKKGAEWRQALKRALAHSSGKTFREGLDKVATAVVKRALEGDTAAYREIADRMDVPLGIESRRRSRAERRRSCKARHASHGSGRGRGRRIRPFRTYGDVEIAG